MTARRTAGQLASLAAVLAALIIGLVGPVALAPAAHADGATIANIARGEVGANGVGNPESPTNSGCNKYTGALFGHNASYCPGAFGNHGSYGWAWCADFATWVWQHAGVDIGGLNSAVSSFRTYGNNHGTYHAAGNGYVPQPGDAIIYGNNSHVGIVVSSGKNPPDAIEGNVLVNGLWQVYLRVNATNAGDSNTVTGYVTPVGGSGGGSSSGGSGPTTGQILGSSCRDLHSGPSGTAPQVDCVPNGATIGIECVKSGSAVSGPYGTETIWDRTVYNGHLGYVSDSWVYTGTNSAVAPDCGGNGVVMTTPCQTLYATPSTSSTALGCVPEAIALTVDCTYTGDSVNGPFGAETLWDHTTYGGSGFVPDAEIYTGTANAIAGTCSSIPSAPTAGSQTLPEAVVNQSYAHALSASGGTGSYTWTVQRGTPPPGLSLASNGTLSGTPTSNGTWTFGVQVVDSYGLSGVATETIPVTIAGALPKVSITAPAAVASLSSSAKVIWTATDTGGPGVARYQARYTRAAFSGGFPTWSYPSSWQSLTTASLTQSGLAPGYDYCWSVRAIDKAGTAGAWSTSKCMAIALDDRSLALSTSGWTRATASAWWNGTATTTKTLNARLSRSSAQLDRVGVIATRCASCGLVGVYVGSTLIGKINMYASTTAYRQILLLPRFGYRTGTVVIKSLTSGKILQIDGLVVSRT